jgi:hypothetical protein
MHATCAVDAYRTQSHDSYAERSGGCTAAAGDKLRCVGLCGGAHVDCEVPLVEKPTHHRRGWRRRPPLAVPVPTWVGSPFAVLLTGLGSGEVHSACKGIVLKGAAPCWTVLQSITVLAH